MNRRVSFLAVVIATAIAMPAAAQIKVRDHRKDKDKDDDRQEERVKAKRGEQKKGTDPIKVTSWAPKSGPVGAEIRIEGEGFNVKTELLVGGKKVRPYKVGDTYLTFRFPASWGDGTIVLRHPNMGDDLVVGTYQVVADPVVRSFAPTSGVGGTRVELSGAGFRQGDQALMNGKPMAVASLSESRIVVTVAADATTDFITVQRPGGPSSRTKAMFKVVQPAPIVTGLSPASGTAGATVRITGTGFADKSLVFYGRWPMAVKATSATSIDAVIPEKAQSDEYVSVRTQWGQGRSPERFHLERPAAIARFSPTYGPAGTRVEIFGDNFAAGDEVLLKGAKVKILQLRPEQISVEIPVGATSGKFAVMRGNVRTHSNDDFEIVNAPQVTGFSPSGGPVGTAVTIAGSAFTPDARVFYGRQELTVDSRSDAALVVKVPLRATDQAFTVRTRGGEASTQTAFKVYTYSTVTGVSPLQGPVGTRVMILGADFARDDRFWLGELELPVAEWAERKVIVTVPQGARSARIAWQTYGQRQESRFAFTVIDPPTVAGFAPASGPAGTQVAIDGANFTRTTKVLFGNDDIRVVKWTATQIVAEIPKAATGTQYLWVVDGDARVRTAQAFQVIAPPAISSFSPAYGKPGIEVTIAGEAFTNASKVRWGRAAVDIVRWTPTSLVVRIPAGAKPGKDYFWVDDGSASQRSPTTFEVWGAATVKGFKPARANVGQEVTITGTGFATGVKVFFGKYECQVSKVAADGRSLTFVLSDAASGKGHLWVHDGDQKSMSSTQLEVIGRENVRDRSR